MEHGFQRCMNSVPSLCRRDDSLIQENAANRTRNYQKSLEVNRFLMIITQLESFDNLYCNNRLTGVLPSNTDCTTWHTELVTGVGFVPHRGWAKSFHHLVVLKIKVWLKEEHRCERRRMYSVMHVQRPSKPCCFFKQSESAFDSVAALFFTCFTLRQYKRLLIGAWAGPLPSRLLIRAGPLHSDLLLDFGVFAFETLFLLDAQLDHMSACVYASITIISILRAQLNESTRL
jgi:hypothetical protein